MTPSEIVQRNDSLWSGDPDATRPTPHSVLRTRSFWRMLYRLDADDPGLSWDVERYRFVYWAGFALSIESAPQESLLRIDGHEAARLDESVTMPHFFRWHEIKAIARHFEGRDDSPRNPSVVTLLLASFLAITDVERSSVCVDLASELSLLGLLSTHEISEILDRRCVPESDWIASPDVGWSLVWREDKAATDKFRPSPIYSERAPGAHFGPRLLELLRAAGVSDTPDPSS